MKYITKNSVLTMLVGVAVVLGGCGGANSADEAAATKATADAAAAEATSCYGSYVGTIVPPPKSVRIAARNIRLASLTPPYILTGDDAKDNAATGGGGIDGGMYLEGSYDFKTDAKCVVTSGRMTIWGEDFSVFGTVDANRTFDLNYGYGPITGKIGGDNSITGTVKEGGNEHVQGTLKGLFTATKVATTK